MNGIAKEKRMFSKRQAAELAARRLRDAIKRQQDTGIEFCVDCLRDMDFPSSADVKSAVRAVGGAHYGAGGQVCATCAKHHSGGDGTLPANDTA